MTGTLSQERDIPPKEAQPEFNQTGVSELGEKGWGKPINLKVSSSKAGKY